MQFTSDSSSLTHFFVLLDSLNLSFVDLLFFKSERACRKFMYLFFLFVQLFWFSCSLWFERMVSSRMLLVFTEEDKVLL